MSQPLTVCFPGKVGDLLWGLPTVRALAEASGQSVNLILSRLFSDDFCELLNGQPYLRLVVREGDWIVQDTAPMTPRTPVGWVEDRTHLSLGYESWPGPDLPRDIYQRAVRAYGPLPELDLETPWITWPLATGTPKHIRWLVGWTDEHFELKAGLSHLLLRKMARSLTEGQNVFDLMETFLNDDLPYVGVVAAPEGRWATEAFNVSLLSWTKLAGNLQWTPIFLSDCSAMHVLAVAVGVPRVVIMEPNAHRHNDVFYPLGKVGRVQLVTGNYGLPTFDARHVWDAIQPKEGG